MISVPGGFDTVLVVDFGAQYAQLIARRVRECHVYSEIVPSTMPVAEMLAKRPKAIILSGGPSSVYADGAPPAPAGLFDAGVPVLGICYGFQLMVAGLGGTVERTGAAEYGRTVLVRGDDPPQTPPAPGGNRSPRPPRPPGGASCWRAAEAPEGLDVARGHLHRGPARLRGDRADRSHPGGRGGERERTACSASSSTPRSCTPSTAPASWAASSSWPAAARPGPC